MDLFAKEATSATDLSKKISWVEIREQKDRLFMGHT